MIKMFSGNNTYKLEQEFNKWEQSCSVVVGQTQLFVHTSPHYVTPSYTLMVTYQEADPPTTVI